MASSLVLQLGLGTLTVATTVLVHVAGLAALIALMRVHRQFFSIRQARLNQAVILVGAGFGLFALHTIEIWGYAVLFWPMAATPTFEDALYYSTVTYATIGYGDCHAVQNLAHPRRDRGGERGHPARLIDGLLRLRRHANPRLGTRMVEIRGVSSAPPPPNKQEHKSHERPCRYRFVSPALGDTE